MPDRDGPRRLEYRVWLCTLAEWSPEGPSDVPPSATAVEPAEDGTMSAEQAARYVESFNQEMLAGRQGFWAVAIPVSISYHGEPTPGQRLAVRTHAPSAR